MAQTTINGVGVIGGSIMMPLQGLWTADLIVDQIDGTGFDAGTKVSIVTPALTLVGTVTPFRTGDFLDTIHVRCIGGVGGMGNTCTPRGYVQPGALFSDVLKGLASDSGESLSSTILPGLLQNNLSAWATTAVPVSQSLEMLMSIFSPNAHWRFLADGTLWVGEETWPANTSQYDLIEFSPIDGAYTLGVDFPAILPGCSIANIGNIGRVEHTFDGSTVRSVVWTQFGKQDRGIKSAISTIVEQQLAPIDYLTLYDVRLVKQEGQLVDVQPLLGTFPGLQRVPLRHGLPGTMVTVAPGALLHLGWDRGDPSRPYACLWDGGESVSNVSITSTHIALGSDTASHPLTLGDNLLSLLTTVASNLTIAAADPVWLILCPTASANILAAATAIDAALPTLNSITAFTVP